MKQLLFLLMALIALPAFAQTVNCGSLFNANLKTQNDVAVDEGSGALVTIQKSTLYTTGKMTFTDATVVLDDANLQCDELEFGAAVTQVHCRGTVKIDCRKIILVAGSTGVTWKSTAAASLTLTTRTPLPASPFVKVEWSSGFTVSLAQR